MVSKGVDLIPMTACVMSLTAVLLFPFMLMLGDPDFAVISTAGWVAVAFTGILCSVTAYVLWSTGLKRMTATTSMIILLSEVVWALVLSFIFLGDSFTLLSAIGAICIVVSMLLASK
jgi:drug/metabolite transporter (DMT)-like permease